MNLLKVFTKYATGSLLALLAGLITTPILTRLISTNEMGKYSMFITVGSLFASVLYLGMDQSYVRYYNEEKEEGRVYLLCKCLKLPLLMTGIISILCFLCYHTLSDILIGEDTISIAILFILYLFGLVINRFCLLKIRMAQKAGFYSVLNVMRKLAYLCFSVILFFMLFGDSSWSLIVAVTLAEFVMLFGAGWVERKDCTILKRETAVTNKQLLIYGAPFIFSTTITLVFHSTDKLMLKALSDYNQIGLYSGAQNIVNLITQVQTVFTTFWLPVAYDHYSKNPQDKNFFIKMNKIVSFAMLMASLVLLCIKDAVVLFLGAKYKDAVYIFPFLAFMPIMYTVSETTVMGINFKEKTNYHVWISIICALINAVGNYFLIINFGAKGAAISTGLSYAVFFLLRTYYANKVYPVKFALRRYLIACIAVYFMAVVASFSKVTLPYLVFLIFIAFLIIFLYRDILLDGINMFKNSVSHK